MASNPLIALGTINIVRTSVVIPNYPALNVTASFLGRGGVNVQLRGPVTTFVDATTGRVTVPEPYVGVGITINLLRSQSLAAAWVKQIKDTSLLGSIKVVPDTSVFPDYLFDNCAIETAPDQAFSSGDAAYNVVIGGTWLVNDAMWSMT